MKLQVIPGTTFKSQAIPSFPGLPGSVATLSKHVERNRSSDTEKLLGIGIDKSKIHLKYMLRRKWTLLRRYCLGTFQKF